MRVFAYCCASFRMPTRKAAGVEPMLSPPTSAETFDVQLLEGQDLIYLDLHGGPGIGFWYGDEGVVALTREQVGGVELGGAVVFATNCYLADENSPMMEALLNAGARYVIGGDGRNWGPPAGRKLYGAAELGLWLRRWMGWGVRPLRALALAKRLLERRLKRDEVLGKKGRVEAAVDTLMFRAYYRKERNQVFQKKPGF